MIGHLDTTQPTTDSIVAQYATIRKQTMDLISPLSPEDFIPQPAVFVSPPKWHLAHTTWFFEEFVLTKYAEDYKLFDKDFSYLFNSYYNTLGDRLNRDNRGVLTRPTVREVLDYRSYVDEHVTKLLEANKSAEIQEIVTLGLQHEQQHQELLITDLKYIFSLNPTHPVYQSEFNFTDKVEAKGEDVIVDAGVYNIGFEGDGFCFDNELSKHAQFINPVVISGNLVTNKEYIEFITDGGYDTHRLWLDEGWAWRNENNIALPLYWKKIEGEFFQYTLSGLKPINPDAPVVHVNYYEAVAFANYKQCRLCTEFEWEAASNKLDWGRAWEWTQSAYLPYYGYKPPAGAVGEYNGKFMVNQMVLRGASVATAKGHSRPTYRNFFHPHYQWQVTGIRLAKEW